MSRPSPLHSGSFLYSSLCPGISPGLFCVMRWRCTYTLMRVARGNALRALLLYGWKEFPLGPGDNVRAISLLYGACGKEAVADAAAIPVGVAEVQHAERREGPAAGATAQRPRWTVQPLGGASGRAIGRSGRLKRPQALVRSMGGRQSHGPDCGRATWLQGRPDASGRWSESAGPQCISARRCKRVARARARGRRTQGH